jgi:outer membrane protein assembly factor BamB
MHTLSASLRSRLRPGVVLGTVALGLVVLGTTPTATSAATAPAPLASATAATTAMAAATGDWPRWRGANFDGTATSGRDLFGAPFALRVGWRQKVGRGYSGVVVAGGRAVTMATAGPEDVLVALAAATGEEAWRLPLGASFPARDGSTGGPVSTPAIADGVVYALGPRGDLVAVELASGRQLWRRQLAAELGAATPHWGFTTSPLVTGELLVVLTGVSPGGAVTAFDRRTGAVVWQSGDDEASYQSPILVRQAGGEQLMAAGGRFLFALDPRTGREAWRHEHGGDGFYRQIINPVVVGDGKLLLNSKIQGWELLAIHPTRESVWNTRDLKLNYGTPVLLAGMICGYSGAFLSCVDAETGTLVWRSRPPGDGFPIVVDGRLVVLTKAGRLVVAEVRPGYRELASLDLFARLAWTPPSFAEGRIYARDSYGDVAAVDIVPVAPAPGDLAAGSPASGAAVASLPPAAAAADPLRAAGDGDFARFLAATARQPDAAQRVQAFLDHQATFPLLEGDHLAHILFTGDAESVVLSSDLLDQGQHQPLARLPGTDLFYATLRLEPDARIHYQLAVGTEPFGPDPKNPRRLGGAAQLAHAGETSLLLMPQSEQSLPTAPATPLGGRLVELPFETATVRIAHLTWGGPRPVKVYLPPGYDGDPTRRYPTLYVLYGEQMLEGGHLDALLDREIGTTLPHLVAVFVPSTSPYEYARTQRDLHRAMLVEQLVPLVDRTFRTLADPRQRFLYGVDEGAFGALETVLRHPTVFANVLAQSVYAVGRGGPELLAEVERTTPAGQRFYLDWGRYDGRRPVDELDVAGLTRTLRERLASRGFAVEGREFADGSDVPLWSARARYGLRWLLQAPKTE